MAPDRFPPGNIFTERSKDYILAGGCGEDAFLLCLLLTSV